MKYCSILSTFKYNWDQVVSSFWQRYPNPYSNHVLTEDVLSRHIDGHQIHSRRLLTKTNPVPKWGEMLVPGSRNVCIIEESIVDIDTKTLTTYTRNIGFTRLMMVEEKCVYRPSPSNPSEFTLCEKQAWIDSSIYGFSRALRAFGLDRFRKNAVKAQKGFEVILSQHYPMPSGPEISPDHPRITLNKDKLLSTAQKAKDLAKAKATPYVAKSSS